MVHYSGHGQQISDISGDEIDGLDEALVSINAPSSIKYNAKYRGEAHLIDDEFGLLINKLRNKVGVKGQVVVIIDACYSGTGVRGNAIVRGGKEPFIFKKTDVYIKPETGSGLYESIEKTRSLNSNLSPYILFSASKPDELNFETTDDAGNNVGSLTYAISKSFNKVDNTSTYSSVFINIMNLMKDIAPYQTPMIEGDINYKVFNGNVEYQQPYFEIDEVVSNNSIRISGGSTSGLAVGDSVSICKAGTMSLDKDLCIVTGTVTQVDNFSSIVSWGKEISINNVKDYWAFAESQSKHDNLFQTYLDFDYYIDIELIPVVLKCNSQGNPQTDKYGNYIIVDTLKLNNFMYKGDLKFNSRSAFMIKFVNKGNKKAYFGAIDIQPDGIINRLYPVENTFAEECILLPKQSFMPNNFIINGFYPPYGKETFVILSNKTKIDLNTVVTQSNKTRSLNYLQVIFEQSEHFKTGSIIPYSFIVGE